MYTTYHPPILTHHLSHQVHVFQMFPFLPATRRAFQNVRSFVQELDQKIAAAAAAKAAQAQTETESDLGLGSDAEETLAQEMSSNAEASHVVRGDGLEVASGRMAGLELANDELQVPTQPDERPAEGTAFSGLGLDLGPQRTDERPIRASKSRPTSPVHSPRRHNRGLTSPLMRMTPATPTPTSFPTRINEISPSPPFSPRPHAPNLPLQSQVEPANRSRTTSSSWLAPYPAKAASPHPTPPPSVRMRGRALSHPDIMDLCASFAARPEMARTRTYSAQGDDE